jgi:hypothetical protein
MECPLCGSRALIRDHASPRAWVLLGLGAAILLGWRLVLPVVLPLLVNAAFGAEPADPERLNTALAAVDHMKRWLLFAGLACALLGALDVILDGSRYCARCGFRGRYPRRRLDPQTAAAVSHLQEATRSARQERTGGTTAGPRGDTHHAPPPVEQPVAPLIRMLRLKNPEMRRDAAATLREVTGEDFGEDADAWEAWWEANRETLKARRREESS